MINDLQGCTLYPTCDTKTQMHNEVCAEYSKMANTNSFNTMKIEIGHFVTMDKKWECHNIIIIHSYSVLSFFFSSFFVLSSGTSRLRPQSDLSLSLFLIPYIRRSPLHPLYFPWQPAFQEKCSSFAKNVFIKFSCSCRRVIQRSQTFYLQLFHCY
jgi:hypothetical protein